MLHWFITPVSQLNLALFNLYYIPTSQCINLTLLKCCCNTFHQFPSRNTESVIMLIISCALCLLVLSFRTTLFMLSQQILPSVAGRCILFWNLHVHGLDWRTASLRRSRFQERKGQGFCWCKIFHHKFYKLRKWVKHLLSDCIKIFSWCYICSEEIALRVLICVYIPSYKYARLYKNVLFGVTILLG